MGQSQSHPPSIAPSSHEDTAIDSWVEVPVPRHVSFSAEENAPGAEYRVVAAKEAALKNGLYQQSQEAWKENRRAEAKKFSSQAKIHAENMIRYHSLAEAEIFAYHNKNYPTLPTNAAPISPAPLAPHPPSSPLVLYPLSLITSYIFAATPTATPTATPPTSTPAPTADEAAKKGLVRLDLHRLFVREAIVRVETHLELCRKHGVRRTTIITGKGLHSIDGIAKIKPKVVEMLSQRGVRIVVDEGKENSGFLVVEFLAVEKARDSKVFGMVAEGNGSSEAAAAGEEEETRRGLGFLWRVLGW
ncbi:hypothetical protein RUND412_002295 [Rhizina undulata]